MKIRLSTILSVILCIVLVCAAVCIGVVRGWSADREAALTALTADGEMYTQLENRAMDAANLVVVAARHLPENDADLTALRGASRELLSGNAGTEALMRADAVITDVALRFASELSQMDSVMASTRDKAYISMLTSSLGKKSGLAYSYNLLVEDFNARLGGTLSGRLAMLLGVAPLPAADVQ